MSSAARRTAPGSARTGRPGDGPGGERVDGADHAGQRRRPPRSRPPLPSGGELLALGRGHHDGAGRAARLGELLVQCVDRVLGLGAGDREVARRGPMKATAPPPSAASSTSQRTTTSRRRRNEARPSRYSSIAMKEASFSSVWTASVSCGRSDARGFSVLPDQFGTHRAGFDIHAGRDRDSHAADHHLRRHARTGLVRAAGQRGREPVDGPGDDGQHGMAEHVGQLGEDDLYFEMEAHREADVALDGGFDGLAAGQRGQLLAHGGEPLGRRGQQFGEDRVLAGEVVQQGRLGAVRLDCDVVQRGSLEAVSAKRRSAESRI